MNSVEQRMHELVGIVLERDLTQQERQELREAHHWITEREWKLARLRNLLFMATQTMDERWATRIAVEYIKTR